MPLYKPSELLAKLASLNIRPKKGLSQNFLIDQNILNKIADLASIDKNDWILEVGPGPGALTEVLLKKAKHVYAVEMDNRWANELKSIPGPLTVFNQDILTFNFDEIKEKEKGKVVANLPYHITTPILTDLVKQRDRFDSIVVMIQEEVARRYIALPNTPDYSSVSLFLNFYADVKYGFKVSRNCFYPAPKVDSAVVFIKLKKPIAEIDEESFFAFTRRTFQQRRKMIKASLKKDYPEEKILRALKNPSARPENLSLEEFLHLYKALNDSHDESLN